MEKTISEKIISEHVGKEMKAGDIAVVDVDMVMSHDGTGPLAVSQAKRIGLGGVKNPEKSIFFIDHAAPSPKKELSNAHMILREFAAQTGAEIKDAGEGICHQILHFDNTLIFQQAVGWSLQFDRREKTTTSSFHILK